MQRKVGEALAIRALDQCRKLVVGETPRGTRGRPPPVAIPERRADRRVNLRSMPGGYVDVQGAGRPRFTVTLFFCVKLSSMPSSENSRPMPLCLTPP